MCGGCGGGYCLVLLSLTRCLVSLLPPSHRQLNEHPAVAKANTIHAMEALFALEDITSTAGAALKCRTVSGAYHDADGDVAFTPRIDTATGDCVLLVKPQVDGWCAFVPRWQHLREPDHFRRFCGCQR